MIGINTALRKSRNSSRGPTVCRNATQLHEIAAQVTADVVNGQIQDSTIPASTGGVPKQAIAVAATWTGASATMPWRARVATTSFSITLTT